MLSRYISHNILKINSLVWAFYILFDDTFDYKTLGLLFKRNKNPGFGYRQWSCGPMYCLPNDTSVVLKFHQVGNTLNTLVNGAIALKSDISISIFIVFILIKPHAPMIAPLVFKT